MNTATNPRNNNTTKRQRKEHRWLFTLSTNCTETQNNCKDTKPTTKRQKLKRKQTQHFYKNTNKAGTRIHKPVKAVEIE